MQRLKETEAGPENRILRNPGAGKNFDPETGKMIGEGKTLPVPCRLKGSRLINYRLKK